MITPLECLSSNALERAGQVGKMRARLECGLDRCRRAYRSAIYFQTASAIRGDHSASMVAADLAEDILAVYVTLGGEAADLYEVAREAAEAAARRAER